MHDGHFLDKVTGQYMRSSDSLSLTFLSVLHIDGFDVPDQYGHFSHSFLSILFSPLRSDSPLFQAPDHDGPSSYSFPPSLSLPCMIAFPRSQVPDQYSAPDPPEYQERGNLREWLLDDKSRDQYVIRYADESEIWWNDPAPDVSLSRF